VRRLAGAPLAIAGSLILVSLFLNLVPGDPVEMMLGEQAPSVDREALRRSVGLDRPWYGQLWLFIRELATGNLRSSLPPFQRKILPQIWAALPNTLLLTFAAMAVAILIAIPLGVAAASRKGTAVDHAAMGIAVAGVALPRFWLGPMLIILFAIDLRWLPSLGMYSARGPAGWQDLLAHLVMPTIATAAAPGAIIARMTRASMLDALRGDFVRTARAKGVGELYVVVKHAFRNAFIPVLTVSGIALAVLFGGAVVIETVFTLPGVGRLLVNAVVRRDYPVVQGTLLLVAAWYVVVNIAVDLLYTVSDPRVRLRTS